MVLKVWTCFPFYLGLESYLGQPKEIRNYESMLLGFQGFYQIA